MHCVYEDIECAWSLVLLRRVSRLVWPPLDAVGSIVYPLTSSLCGRARGRQDIARRETTMRDGQICTEQQAMLCVPRDVQIKLN